MLAAIGTAASATIQDPNFWGNLIQGIANPSLKGDLAAAQGELGSAVQQAQQKTAQLAAQQEREKGQREKEEAAAKRRSTYLLIGGGVCVLGGTVYALTRRKGKGGKRSA